MKPPSTLNGHRWIVRRPRGTSFLNYEGELAVVIGRRMKGVGIDEALDYVAGYAPANDVGLHDFRHADRGSMLRVKGQDGFLPIGPWVVPAGEFDPAELHAAHATERRGRPGGDGRGLDLGRRLSAGRPLAADHARARRRRADRHARATRGRWSPATSSRSRSAARARREHDRRLGRRPDGRRRAAGCIRQHPARRARHPRGRGRADRRARRES